MPKPLKITICGGDKRYIKTYQLFSKNGFETSYTNTENLKDLSTTDVLILPIASFDREGILTGSQYSIYDILNIIKSGTVIFAGKVPSIITRIASEHKVKIFDYTNNEEFNILNAVSTAEGAILTALEITENTISQSKITVLGYGRIGKALSVRLKNLGGIVTVGARSLAAQANAICDGITACDIATAIKKASDSSIIFNTIPAPVITEENINAIKSRIIIDLASIPGGLSEAAKSISGENFIHALSLPGKHFPNTAGEVIYKTITGTMREEGLIQ